MARCKGVFDTCPLHLLLKHNNLKRDPIVLRQRWISWGFLAHDPLRALKAGLFDVSDQDLTMTGLSCLSWLGKGNHSKLMSLSLGVLWHSLSILTRSFLEEKMRFETSVTFGSWIYYSWMRFPWSITRNDFIRHRRHPSFCRCDWGWSHGGVPKFTPEASCLWYILLVNSGPSNCNLCFSVVLYKYIYEQRILFG